MASLEQTLSSIRIEISDRDKVMWQDDELIRAIEKTCSLMSRLLPKKSVVTATLDNAWIDGNYVDISSVLDADQKLGDAILRVEYPTGSSPPEFIAFEVIGDYLWLKTNVTVEAGKDIRVIYQGVWTPPSHITPGDYPPHLNDVVVVGATGQALIFRAEHFVHLSAAVADRIPSLLDILAGIEGVEIPDIEIPEAPALEMPELPDPYIFTKPTAPTLPEKPVPPTPITLSALTPPAFEDFVTTDQQGKYVPPTPPSLPTPMPTPPSAPTGLDTDIGKAGTALDAAIAAFVAAMTAIGSMDSNLTCGAERICLLPDAVTNARTFQSTGEPLVNKVTVGDKVGEIYNQYALTEVSIARESVQSGVAYTEIAAGWEAKAGRAAIIGTGYVQEAVQRLAVVGKKLEQYATEVNAYKAELDGFIAEINGTVGIFQAEIQGEATGASLYAAAVDGFRGIVTAQATEVQLYGQNIQRYLSEIQAFGEEVRFLVALFQAEIQAEVAGVQSFSESVRAYEATIRAEEAKVSIFSKQIDAYAAAMRGTESLASIYATQAKAIKDTIDGCVAQQKQYLELAGRYLASGQSKINEFLVTLGYKPELHKTSSSAEQRS